MYEKKQLAFIFYTVYALVQIKMQLVRIFSRLQLHKNRGEAWPFLNIEI